MKRIHPAAPWGCGERRCVGLVTMAVLVTTTPVMAQPTAQEIVRRERAAIAGIKTYRGMWRMTSTGAGGSRVTTLEVAAMPRAGKCRIVSTSAAAGRRPASRMILIDDGKNRYNYSSQGKRWLKSPHSAASGWAFADSLRITAENEQRSKLTYSLLPSTSLGGRPVYVVRVNYGAGVAPGSSRSMTLYIDQATYRRRQSLQKQSVRLSNGRTASTSVKTEVLRESIDASIPSRTFRFAIPGGSKPLKKP